MERDIGVGTQEEEQRQAGELGAEAEEPLLLPTRFFITSVRIVGSWRAFRYHSLVCSCAEGKGKLQQATCLIYITMF